MKTDRKNTPESKPVPQPKLFKRVVLHTAIATAVLTGAYGRNAYAGSCNVSGNTLVCSGAADPDSDVTQEIVPSGDSVVMTTDAGFGIETGSGSALSVKEAVGFSFTDAYQSLITGQANGIEVGGIGDISITTTGTVTGVDNYGIHVFRGSDETRQGSQSGALTINAANVYGGKSGIIAYQQGSGSLTITTSGTVSGGTKYGISAVNKESGTDTTIKVADVYGEIVGIAAHHYGAGTLSISSSGTVTAGEDGDGIVAMSYEDATGSTVTAGDVNAGGFGIFASHGGAGNLSITSTGIVTAGGDGITANSNEDSTGSTITSGNIDAGGIGISAYHIGTGNVSITAGNIESVKEGISVTLGSPGSDVTITSGSITSSEGAGILLENYGSGAISITTTGSVLGQGEGASGIHAYQLAKGTDMVIDAQQDVTGDYEGIHAENNGSGLLSITSTGAVTAGSTGINAVNAGSATTITAGDVSAGLTGIVATQEGEGSLSITSTGTVTGESLDGIRARVGTSGTDLTIRALDINSGENGIEASNDGSGNTSITANGTVTAKGAKGINAVNSVAGGNLSITAHNTSGLTFGIDARNKGTGSLSITSTGTASGGSRGISALSEEGSTDAIVSANNVYGDYGVAVTHYGSGEVSITTSGNVVGENESGIAVFNSANGTGLSIDSAGTLTSERYGIYALHDGSGEVEIHNSGIVTATNGQALFLDRRSSGSVGGIISNSGSLTSGSRAAVLLTEGFDFSGEFSNQGDIAGGNGIAFDASANLSGFVFTQRGGQVEGDVLLGLGDDRVIIQGGAINGDIVGQGNDDIVVDLAADTAFTLHDIVGVRDFTIRNGRVNQAGDFSAVNTKVESGATMAFDTLVNGTGNLVVDGELHFSDDGKLVLNGSVTLNEGGLIQAGDFSAVNTKIESGATMAFDTLVNGTGSLVVDGELRFSDDGKLVQNGSVTLNEGSLITLDMEIGMSQYFDFRAEVIEASELIDNGAKVEDNSLLFDINLSIDSGIGAVTSEVADLGAVSGKANASAFGNAVAAQAKIDRNFNNPAVAVLANLGDGDVAGFEQSADSFSPSVSGAIRYSAQAGNTIAMDAVRDRLLHASRETTGLPQQFWLGGFSGTGEHDAVDEVEGFESETSAAVFGYDHQWQRQNGAQWQAGAALVTSSTDTDNNRFAADAIATDSSQLVVYSGYSQGSWQWQGAVSLAALEYDLERNSLAAGESTISGETEGSLMGLSATASYALKPYSGVSLRPLLTLQYSSLSVDEFAENGGMGLTVEYEGIDTLSSELGIDAAFKPFALGNDWMLAPQARISWSHEFLAEVETATARFGDQAFIQSGFEPVQDRINVDAGVELVNDRNLRFSFDYRGKFGGDFNSSQATLGMRYAF